MKTRTLLVLMICLVWISLITGCGPGGADSDSDQGISTAQSAQVAPPEEYSSFKNPYEGQQDAIAAGDTLFQANCSSCHGSAGKGDGPAAAGLNPKPKNLSQNQAGLDDGYLYWRISEGGLMEPFNSVMPAWKGLLDEKQIWQIISFIRTL